MRDVGLEYLVDVDLDGLDVEVVVDRGLGGRGGEGVGFVLGEEDGFEDHEGLSTHLPPRVSQ